MLSYLRTLQTFLHTLLLTPAVVLAQVGEYEPDVGYERGWGWGWLLVAIVVVLALVGWAASRRRGGRRSAVP